MNWQSIEREHWPYSSSPTRHLMSFVSSKKHQSGFAWLRCSLPIHLHCKITFFSLLCQQNEWVSCLLSKGVIYFLISQIVIYSWCLFICIWLPSRVTRKKIALKMFQSNSAERRSADLYNYNHTQSNHTLTSSSFSTLQSVFSHFDDNVVAQEDISKVVTWLQIDVYRSILLQHVVKPNHIVQAWHFEMCEKITSI